MFTKAMRTSPGATPARTSATTRQLVAAIRRGKVEGIPE